MIKTWVENPGDGFQDLVKKFSGDDVFFFLLNIYGWKV